MSVVAREATAQELLRWDEIVVRFANYRLFHKMSWIRSIEAFTGARVLYLVLEKDGEIVGAVPGFLARVAFVKLFASPREGWQTDSMGPVFHKDRISTREIFAALIPFLEGCYGIQHMELVSADLDPVVMKELGFRDEPLFTYRVSLFPGDEEKVMRNIHRRTRTYLRKLVRTGLTAQIESQESFVDEFYEQTKEVFARRRKAVPFSRLRALELFRHMKASGNLLALSVHGPGGGVCMATGVFLIEGSELYLWGWTHRVQYGCYHPTELLTWTAMRKAMESGCVSFDMGGGGDGKIKFGGIPEVTTRRWIRSRYEWLSRSRNWARAAYKWQQSLRGRMSGGAAVGRKASLNQTEVVEMEMSERENGSMISRVACPVCGLSVEKAIVESPNYFFCPSCGVIYRRQFRRPVPEEGWDKDYYSDRRVLDYYNRRYSGFRKIVSLVDGCATGRGKWLDVGCGPGALLEVARQRGWKVYGIDPSAISVEIARRQVKDAVIALGTVEETLREFAGLTVVSLMNVLRCIEGAGASLRALRDVLVDDGWVVIRETNADAERRVRRKETPRVEVTSSMALQLWKPRALEKALSLAGFRNVRSLPSPTFTETVNSERGGERGLSDNLKKVLKWGAWPVSRVVHVLSGGRTYLGPNFISLAQR